MTPSERASLTDALRTCGPLWGLLAGGVALTVLIIAALLGHLQRE